MIPFVSAYLFFVLAFNTIWEFSHAPLYTPESFTRGHTETLVWATAGDVMYLAILYGVIALLFKNRAWGREPLVRHIVMFATLALVLAWFIEWKADVSGKWTYTDAMPLVPALGVGLTPFIQLAATGLLSLYFARRFAQQKSSAIVSQS